MARTSNLTGASQVADIDVVRAAAGIAAGSYFQSAALRIADTTQGDRKRTFIIEGDLTFAAQASEGTANAAQSFDPVGNEVTCTLDVCDAVLTQEAIKDGRTSGRSLQQMVVNAGTQAYVKRADARFAALHAKVETASPDHVIGSSTTPISLALIDDAIQLALTAGLPTPYALVVKTSVLPALMNLPGMRDYAVKGADGPGGIAGLMMSNDPLVVRGYGSVLDIYHSPQIITSTGTHNILTSVGTSPEHRGLVNPWTPVETDMGPTQGKLLVDPYWNSAERSLDINMTTIEAFEFRDTTASTDSTWGVKLTTSPA